MEEKKIKLAIGFIIYGKSTAKYLPYFLPSLVGTTDLPAGQAGFHMITHDSTDRIKILCFDNSEEEDSRNVEYIKKNYPGIEIMRAGENLGFAKAHNRMIKRAKESGAEYFLALNPDMILESGAIQKMIEVLDEDRNLGSVCPKILRWDFANNKKTDIIDSCGIKQLSALNFYDLGQSEKDIGQCEDKEMVGPSGAAAMYRMSALETVKEVENYFDELMFMYKEDCDLAYRLFLKGFKSKCASEAIIYHDRTAGGKGESNFEIALNRKNKSRQVKGWSFLSQQIIFIKYWHLQNLKEKAEISWYAFRMFVFAVLFEQYLLKEYFNLWKLKKNIKKYK